MKGKKEKQVLINLFLRYNIANTTYTLLHDKEDEKFQFTIVSPTLLHTPALEPINHTQPHQAPSPLCSFSFLSFFSYFFSLSFFSLFFFLSFFFFPEYIRATAPPCINQS